MSIFNWHELAPDLSKMREACHRDRRERIATEAMKAFLSGPRADGSTYEQVSHHAVYCADALIAELDKPKEVKP